MRRLVFSSILPRSAIQLVCHAREKGRTRNQIPWRAATFPKGYFRWRHVSRWHTKESVEKSSAPQEGTGWRSRRVAVRFSSQENSFTHAGANKQKENRRLRCHSVEDERQLEQVCHLHAISFSRGQWLFVLFSTAIRSVLQYASCASIITKLRNVS